MEKKKHFAFETLRYITVYTTFFSPWVFVPVLKAPLNIVTTVSDGDGGGLCRKLEIFLFFQGEKGTPGVKGTHGHIVKKKHLFKTIQLSIKFYLRSLEFHLYTVHQEAKPLFCFLFSFFTRVQKACVVAKVKR